MGFGSKYSVEDLRHTARNVKYHLGRSYDHAKHVLGKLDEGMHTVRIMHHVVKPTLQIVHPEANKSLTKMIKSYDSIRDNVVAADRALQTAGHVADFVGKRAGINIGI